MSGRRSRTGHAAVAAGAFCALAVAAPTAAHAGACEGTFETTASSVEGTPEHLGGTGPVVNNSPNPSKSSYTVTSTKSAGGTTSVQGTVSAGAAVVQAEVSVGADWTYDVTTSTSRTVEMTIDPGATGSIDLERVPVTTYVTQYRLLPNCERGSQSGRAEVTGSIVRTTIN
jgi:hypothetical protein